MDEDFAIEIIKVLSNINHNLAEINKNLSRINYNVGGYKNTIKFNEKV